MLDGLSTSTKMSCSLLTIGINAFPIVYTARASEITMLPISPTAAAGHRTATRPHCRHRRRSHALRRHSHADQELGRRSYMCKVFGIFSQINPSQFWNCFQIPQCKGISFYGLHPLLLSNGADGAKFMGIRPDGVENPLPSLQLQVWSAFP